MSKGWDAAEYWGLQVLRSLITTIALGGLTSSAFLLGIPSLVETQARDRLLTAFPRSTPLSGLNIASASFNSLGISHLFSALIGFPAYTVTLNQPTALFSHPSAANDGGNLSFQASASRLSLNLDSGTQGDGTFSVERVIISPLPQSSTEIDLSRALLVDYQKAPVLMIDEATAALPRIIEAPRQAFSESLETLTRGIIGAGAKMPFAASARLSVKNADTTVPLSVREKEHRFYLTADKTSLTSIPLRDPLTEAEVAALESSPLALSYLILLRTSAEVFARRLIDEQSNARENGAPPSALSIRFAVYGYLISRIFGVTEGHKLGELFCAGRDQLPSIGESTQDARIRSQSTQLLNIGFLLAERELINARDLPRAIAKRGFLSNLARTREAVLE